MTQQLPPQWTRLLFTDPRGSHPGTSGSRPACPPTHYPPPPGDRYFDPPRPKILPTPIQKVSKIFRGPALPGGVDLPLKRNLQWTHHHVCQNAVERDGDPHVVGRVGGDQRGGGQEEAKQRRHGRGQGCHLKALGWFREGVGV